MNRAFADLERINSVLSDRVQTFDNPIPGFGGLPGFGGDDDNPIPGFGGLPGFGGDDPFPGFGGLPGFGGDDPFPGFATTPGTINNVTSITELPTIALDGTEILSNVINFNDEEFDEIGEEGFFGNLSGLFNTTLLAATNPPNPDDTGDPTFLSTEVTVGTRTVELPFFPPREERVIAHRLNPNTSPFVAGQYTLFGAFRRIDFQNPPLQSGPIPIDLLIDAVDTAPVLPFKSGLLGREVGLKGQIGTQFTGDIYNLSPIPDGYNVAQIIGGEGLAARPEGILDPPEQILISGGAIFL